MRSVLIYLSILAAALTGGIYFARALIDPAVYALAALPSPPSAVVPSRFAKSPPPARNPCRHPTGGRAIGRRCAARSERPVESGAARTAQSK